MKTKPFHFLSSVMIAVLGIVMSLTSCSTELATYIPQDAIVVGNVDVQSIWQNGDVDNIDNLSFVKLLRQELRNEDPQVAALVDEIIKDPSSTGLNLKSDVMCFADTKTLGVVAQMRKVSQFEDFLMKCGNLNGEKMAVADKNGYKIARLDESMAIVYTHDIAMLVIGIEDNIDEETIAQLMSTKRDNSIASNKNFKEYWKNHTESGIWMDMSSFLDLVESYGGEEALSSTVMGASYIDELKKGSVSANLVFDKGVIRLKFDNQGINPKMWKAYAQKFNGDLVKYMPEKSFMAFSFAFNMNEMVRILANSDDLDIEMDEEVVDGLTLQQLLESFGGSMLFSLFDMEGLMPQMSFAVDIKDNKVIEKVFSEMNIKPHNGYYLVPDMGVGMQLYFAVNKKVLYLTNSQAAITQFVDGGYRNGMGSIASKIKNGNYVYTDLNMNHYPVSVTSLIPSNIVQMLAQYFDYTEIIPTGESSGEWRIFLADKKQNSLLYTLHFIDDHLVELGNLAESMGGSDDYSGIDEDYLVDEDDDWQLDI